MKQKDSEKMVMLAKEGKQISKIQLEVFPEYSYEDIYLEVYGSGEKGSQGVKNAMTRRLNKLATLPPDELPEMVEELRDLLTYLYANHRTNQKKLEDIRKVIEG